MRLVGEKYKNVLKLFNTDLANSEDPISWLFKIHALDWPDYERMLKKIAESTSKEQTKGLTFYLSTFQAA